MPPGLVTVRLRVPVAAMEEIVTVAVIEFEVMAVVEAVMSVPESETDAPALKLDPETVTLMTSAWLPYAGAIPVTTGELFSTVNPELRVTYFPSL